MKLIVITDSNWAIGKDNKPLFCIPGDLEMFRKKTMGHTVVMGRKTFESLPGGMPLPGRKNVVLSRNGDFSPEGVTVFSGEPAQLPGGFSDDIYVIGGGEVYRELLPFCDTAYVTRVDVCSKEPDTFMVDLDADDEWVKTDVSEDLEENGFVYRFITYKRE